MKYLHRVIAIINIWRLEFIPGFANKDKEKKKKDLRKGQLRKGNLSSLLFRYLVTN